MPELTAQEHTLNVRIQKVWSQTEEQNLVHQKHKEKTHLILPTCLNITSSLHPKL